MNHLMIHTLFLLFLSVFPALDHIGVNGVHQHEQNVDEHGKLSSSSSTLHPVKTPHSGGDTSPGVSPGRENFKKLASKILVANKSANAFRTAGRNNYIKQLMKPDYYLPPKVIEGTVISLALNANNAHGAKNANTLAIDDQHSSQKYPLRSSETTVNLVLQYVQRVLSAHYAKQMAVLRHAEIPSAGCNLSLVPDSDAARWTYAFEKVNTLPGEDVENFTDKHKEFGAPKGRNSSKSSSAEENGKDSEEDGGSSAESEGEGEEKEKKQDDDEDDVDEDEEEEEEDAVFLSTYALLQAIYKGRDGFHPDAKLDWSLLPKNEANEKKKRIKTIMRRIKNVWTKVKGLGSKMFENVKKSLKESTSQTIDPAKIYTAAYEQELSKKSSKEHDKVKAEIGQLAAGLEKKMLEQISSADEAERLEKEFAQMAKKAKRKLQKRIDVEPDMSKEKLFDPMHPMDMLEQIRFDIYLKPVGKDFSQITGAQYENLFSFFQSEKKNGFHQKTMLDDSVLKFVASKFRKIDDSFYETAKEFFKNPKEFYNNDGKENLSKLHSYISWRYWSGQKWGGCFGFLNINEIKQNKQGKFNERQIEQLEIFLKNPDEYPKNMKRLGPEIVEFIKMAFKFAKLYNSQKNLSQLETLAENPSEYFRNGGVLDEVNRTFLSKMFEKTELRKQFETDAKQIYEFLKSPEKYFKKAAGTEIFKFIEKSIKYAKSINQLKQINFEQFEYLEKDPNNFFNKGQKIDKNNREFLSDIFEISHDEMSPEMKSQGQHQGSDHDLEEFLSDPNGFVEKAKLLDDSVLEFLKVKYYENNDLIHLRALQFFGDPVKMLKSGVKLDIVFVEYLKEQYKLLDPYNVELHDDKHQKMEMFFKNPKEFLVNKGEKLDKLVLKYLDQKGDELHYVLKEVQYKQMGEFLKNPSKFYKKGNELHKGVLVFLHEQYKKLEEYRFHKLNKEEFEKLKRLIKDPDTFLMKDGRIYEEEKTVDGELRQFLREKFRPLSTSQYEEGMVYLRSEKNTINDKEIRKIIEELKVKTLAGESCRQLKKPLETALYSPKHNYAKTLRGRLGAQIVNSIANAKSIDNNLIQGIIWSIVSAGTIAILMDAILCPALVASVAISVPPLAATVAIICYSITPLFAETADSFVIKRFMITLEGGSFLPSSWETALENLIDSGKAGGIASVGSIGNNWLELHKGWAFMPGLMITNFVAGVTSGAMVALEVEKMENYQTAAIAYLMEKGYYKALNEKEIGILVLKRREEARNSCSRRLLEFITKRQQGTTAPITPEERQDAYKNYIKNKVNDAMHIAKSSSTSSNSMGIGAVLSLFVGFLPGYIGLQSGIIPERFEVIEKITSIMINTPTEILSYGTAAYMANSFGSKRPLLWSNDAQKHEQMVQLIIGKAITQFDDADKKLVPITEKEVYQIHHPKLAITYPLGKGIVRSMIYIFDNFKKLWANLRGNEAPTKMLEHIDVSQLAKPLFEDAEEKKSEFKLAEIPAQTIEMLEMPGILMHLEEFKQNLVPRLYLHKATFTEAHHMLVALSSQLQQKQWHKQQIGGEIQLLEKQPGKNGDDFFKIFVENIGKAPLYQELKMEMENLKSGDKIGKLAPIVNHLLHLEVNIHKKGKLREFDQMVLAVKFAIKKMYKTEQQKSVPFLTTLFQKFLKDSTIAIKMDPELANALIRVKQSLDEKVNKANMKNLLDVFNKFDDEMDAIIEQWEKQKHYLYSKVWHLQKFDEPPAWRWGTLTSEEVDDLRKDINHEIEEYRARMVQKMTFMAKNWENLQQIAEEKENASLPVSNKNDEVMDLQQSNEQEQQAPSKRAQLFVGYCLAKWFMVSFDDLGRLRQDLFNKHRGYSSKLSRLIGNRRLDRSFYNDIMESIEKEIIITHCGNMNNSKEECEEVQIDLLSKWQEYCSLDVDFVKFERPQEWAHNELVKNAGFKLATSICEQTAVQQQMYHKLPETEGYKVEYSYLHKMTLTEAHHVLLALKKVVQGEIEMEKQTVDIAQENESGFMNQFNNELKKQVEANLYRKINGELTKLVNHRELDSTQLTLMTKKFEAHIALKRDVQYLFQILDSLLGMFGKDEKKEEPSWLHKVLLNPIANFFTKSPEPDVQQSAAFSAQFKKAEEMIGKIEKSQNFDGALANMKSILKTVAGKIRKMNSAIKELKTEKIKKEKTGGAMLEKCYQGGIDLVDVYAKLHENINKAENYYGVYINQDSTKVLSALFEAADEYADIAVEINRNFDVVVSHNPEPVIREVQNAIKDLFKENLLLQKGLIEFSHPYRIKSLLVEPFGELKKQYQEGNVNSESDNSELEQPLLRQQKNSVDFRPILKKLELIQKDVQAIFVKLYEDETLKRYFGNEKITRFLFFFKNREWVGKEQISDEDLASLRAEVEDGKRQWLQRAEEKVKFLVKNAELLQAHEESEQAQLKDQGQKQIEQKNEQKNIVVPPPPPYLGTKGTRFGHLLVGYCLAKQFTALFIEQGIVDARKLAEDIDDRDIKEYGVNVTELLGDDWRINRQFYANIAEDTFKDALLKKCKEPGNHEVEVCDKAQEKSLEAKWYQYCALDPGNAKYDRIEELKVITSDGDLNK